MKSKKDIISPERIGIFGGSFNPIHIGHFIIANFFLFDFKLDICYFVPNHISPFKMNEPGIIDDFHRIKMIEISIKENPKFAIDTYEVDKGGISYSFETVLHFKNKFPNSEIFFLIGSDQLQMFIQWKNWQIILENSYLVVAKRVNTSTEKKFLPEDYHNKILHLNNPLIEISSTQIRNYVRCSRPIDYLVPNQVKKYIEKNKLYKN